MEIGSVGIIGAGLMGSGIAEVCARNGIRTLVTEAGAEQLAAGQRRVSASLERGRRPASSATRTSNGSTACSPSRRASRTSPSAISASRRSSSSSRRRSTLFEQLDRIVSEDAILATNTSALPIIEIARATRRPDRVIGTHFFNPAPVMKLIEVVRSIATSDETLDETRALGETLGKRIIVAQDRGGFIVNLLLIPFLTHAIRLYESGFATREDIDEGMRLGCGHPMGPLQLLDYIGLDTALFVCESLYEEYANSDFAPPPLLRRMVSAGYLGRKSGRGFYEY